MENLIINEQQIRGIYSMSYTVSESRGKERQNSINRTLVSCLKNLKEYEDCEFLFEVRLKKNEILWGEHFAVDVQVLKDGELTEILLFKAPASNLAQNHVNALNSKAGELLRLAKLASKGIKIKFLSLLPNKTPYFTRDDSIKHFETNSPSSICYVKEYLTFDFQEITITFDIEGIESCKSRQDITELLTTESVITNIKTCVF